MNGMTIGQIAKATQTKVPTVRFYEGIGLLEAPARSEGNQRLYNSDALARLSFIRRARDLGFPIDQVRALLDLSDDRDRSCCEIDAIAAAHLVEVDRKIKDLKALRRELSGLLDQCRQNVVADCRIIEALGPSSKPGDTPR